MIEKVNLTEKKKCYLSTIICGPNKTTTASIANAKSRITIQTQIQKYTRTICVHVIVMVVVFTNTLSLNKL